MIIKNNERKRKGASVIEYIVLIVFIVAALLAMKDTMSRAIFSKYKSSGDSFAFGQQYDAKRTTICKTDVVKYSLSATTKTVSAETITYDEDCYQSKVMKTCPQCQPDDTSCFDCEDSVKRSCHNDYCNR